MELTDKRIHRPNLQKKQIPLFIDLYRTMVTAREIDILEQHYINQGEAFFHVSGKGHEAVASLNPHLIPQDYLHCHYRDKALLIARGISPEMFFHSLFCNDASHSRGRQMSAHMSDRQKNILSMVGPVGNNALQAVGVAAEIKNHSECPLVVCALGDGTTQQGEVLEAIAEAVRWQLPVLFLIEDNRYSISTMTEKKTFFSLPDHIPQTFYGMPIHRVDGWDTIASYYCFKQNVLFIRTTRNPALIAMSVERLANHTNADDQTIYRNLNDIERAHQEADPIKILASKLNALEIEIAQLEQIDHEVRETVKDAAKRALCISNPIPTFGAKKILTSSFYDISNEYIGNKFHNELTMREAICEVLRQRMKEDSRIMLYGEDIEDPKGDVFVLTKGLSSEFPGRVLNSPLSESTIVGASIGRALAGGKPVAFLQFADFLPLAFNQIVSELGSMYWRTDGSWECPVIIMATCGGYKPGLGPFHAQSLEAITVHTPGLDVFIPSIAGDAAGMLNAAFDSGRPTIFFYPKKCLNDHNAMTSSDARQHFVPIGKARIDSFGRDITLVAYGNTVKLCRKAAEVLATEGIEAEVIDLRCLSPWDELTVLNSACKTGKLLVAHEDNHSCGMAGEIMATVAEKASVPITMRRVTRADTYIPCNYSNQIEVLPSFKGILEAAAELLDLSISWVIDQNFSPEIFTLEAMGTSPSDDEVLIVEWNVKEGQEIKEGDVLVTLESSKSTMEFESPTNGIIKNILIDAGQEVKVGTPILNISISQENMIKPKSHNQENPGKPLFRRKKEHTHEMARELASDSSIRNQGVPQPLNGIRKSMAKSMELANAEVVPVTIWDDVDIQAWKDKDDITVRLIQAVVMACKLEPNLNSWYENKTNDWLIFNQIHLGLAIDYVDGLFVPVLRDVASKKPSQLRQEIDKIKKAVYERTLTRDNMSNSTFTISNFGIFGGGRYATPTVIPPSVAILAAGRIHQGVVVIDGKAEIRWLLPLSLTFDHRVITGGEAARFMAEVIHDLNQAK